MLLCPATRAVFIHTVALLFLLLLIKTYLPLWRRGLFTLPTIGPTQSITQEKPMTVLPSLAHVLKLLL